MACWGTIVDQVMCVCADLTSSSAPINEILEIFKGNFGAPFAAVK